MSNKKYRFDYIAEEFYSAKKNKPVFCVRLALYKDDKLLRKSNSLFWLNEDEYLDFISEN